MGTYDDYEKELLFPQDDSMFTLSMVPLGNIRNWYDISDVNALFGHAEENIVRFVLCDQRVNTYIERMAL